MSILDVASQAPTRSRAKSPTTFALLRDAVYDDETARTYQLVRNEKNRVPYMLSCEGNHPNALAVHNERAVLTFDRKSLDDEQLPKDADKAKAARAVRAAKHAALTAKLAALTPLTVCERTPYVTRGLTVYSERGIE